MPVQWNDAKEKQLLLSIIHHLQPSAAAIPWTEVAKAVDPEASEKACSEKLKKLRSTAKAQYGEPLATAEGREPKTPAKRGRKSTSDTPTKSAGKRKSKNDKLNDYEAVKSEEGASEESLAKKLKTEDDDGED